MENVEMKKGFTLVELLLVVAILAILAGLILPEYGNQTEKARISEALNTLSIIRKGEETYRVERGTYLAINPGAPSSDWLKIGATDLNDSAVYPNRFWNYSVENVTDSVFSAIATRNNQGDPAFEGRRVGIQQDGGYCGDHPFGPRGVSSC